MQITVFYVGSSLLAPLKRAEQEINRAYDLDLHVATYNFGAPLGNSDWQRIEVDLSRSEVVFVIHVMDGENASRLIAALQNHLQKPGTVVVINCMPELMRQTRMGRLNSGQPQIRARTNSRSRQVMRLFMTIGAWIGNQIRRGGTPHGNSHRQYLNLVNRLPRMLMLMPGAGKLRDVKNYLLLFCYFLQPTPANIRCMLLYALKHYVADDRMRKLKIDLPQTMPATGIYHPDAPALFSSFQAYKKWYRSRNAKSEERGSRVAGLTLDADATIGLLLMRPQVISKTTKHYDALIRTIEAEGLSVIPAISTLMDNREAVTKFFIDENSKKDPKKARVSQIVSLTGFSFVGGPAMNDSEAASNFLLKINRPYRSAVSLDMQTVEAWTESQMGLNPVQLGMQVAIPELDGATEPWIYGGIPIRGLEPVPLEDRCRIFARRLKRWNRMRTAPRDQLKLALVLFCFPPNKGNIGTAADLEVFSSVWETLKALSAESYGVNVPSSPEALRESLLHGNSDRYASTTNVTYRMGVEEYRRLCPFVADAEKEWGRPPGRKNSLGNELLIQGVTLGNVFVGVQPTFGYEGDPMRLMMARSGSPHHGFLAFYTYISRVFAADAVVHVGTHGALEFMPGKQAGLSGECWPDRLIGELPNIYLYSVNNPSEGSIAKRRSYAELISYLTPPIENAGLYKELASLKELITAYRQTEDESEKGDLFESISESSARIGLATFSKRGRESVNSQL